MQRNGKSSHTLNRTVQPPEVPVQPPEVPVQPPEVPVQPPEVPVQPPEVPVQPPEVLVQPPEVLVQPPEVLVQPPEPRSRVRMAQLRRRLGGYTADARVSRRLLAAPIAIEMVLGDAGLRARMAAHGYDDARMAEGQALYAQALAQHQNERAQAGAQRAAATASRAAQAHAHIAYMRHVQIARVALRDDDSAAQALDLAATRKRATADWLLQARQFYTAALAGPAIIAAFARYGVDTAGLLAAQTEVDAVGSLAIARHGARQATWQATAARSTAMAALDAWMRDFMALARVALGQ